MLERSCRDRVQWVAAHPGHPLDLSVNVSASQLMVAGFCAAVSEVLDATGMDPTALVLEVTEGIFIEDGDRAMSVLADLKEMGVRLASDDFGTGYCSMGYPRRFPVDMVKIDQGFVADIGRAPTGAAIVAAVSSLAHVLGLSVTAEGVETEQQRDEVVSIGCELAQGFHYARPMTSLDISAQLAASQGHPLHLPREQQPAAV